jgi:hypothetical protein
VFIKPSLNMHAQLCAVMPPLLLPLLLLLLLLLAGEC